MGLVGINEASYPLERPDLILTFYERYLNPTALNNVRHSTKGHSGVFEKPCCSCLGPLKANFLLEDSQATIWLNSDYLVNCIAAHKRRQSWTPPGPGQKQHL